jgi:hypothetical protein
VNDDLTLRARLVDQIALWRENVLDLDTAADDQRRQFEIAFDAWKLAEKDRNLAVLELAALIDQYRAMRRARPPAADEDASC